MLRECKNPTGLGRLYCKINGHLYSARSLGPADKPVNKHLTIYVVTGHGAALLITLMRFALTSRLGALLTNAFLGYSTRHKTTQKKQIVVDKTSETRCQLAEVLVEGAVNQ